MTEPITRQDTRFGDETAGATPWADVRQVLETAELYWITTVRADGRPHVTPLVAVWHDEAFHFCTGLEEQKAVNIAHNPHVAVTTGTNTWQQGLDVVIEGEAVRVAGGDTLGPIADTYRAKYGSAWDFGHGDDAFQHAGGVAAVFRVVAAKVLAFGKDPHSQTAFDFPG
jgi:Pyridoxamine 5'-phosphate oxidase